MPTSSPATRDAHTISDGLANAAAAAGYAPSIHDTQPWRGALAATHWTSTFTAAGCLPLLTRTPGWRR